VTRDVHIERCVCGAKLPAAEQALARAYDHVELPPIKPVTTRINLHRADCPCCGKSTTAEPPADMPPGSPFGPGIAALVTYLHGCQMVGYARLAEMLEGLFGLKISEGAIANMLARTAEPLAECAQTIHETVRNKATAGRFQTLGTCTLGRPNNTPFDLDVAIVLLEDAEFERLVHDNWRVLDESNVTRFDQAVSIYIVAGYPLETLVKTRMNWRQSFTRVYTNPYHGGLEDADHQMFRLNYSRSAPGSSGRLQQTPNLRGVSGASVWALTNNNPGYLWARFKIVKVVAIQVAFKHDTYIAAEWWTLVQEVLQSWGRNFLTTCGPAQITNMLSLPSCVLTRPILLGAWITFPQRQPRH
jgi:transposase